MRRLQSTEAPHERVHAFRCDDCFRGDDSRHGRFASRWLLADGLCHHHPARAQRRRAIEARLQQVERVPRRLRADPAWRLQMRDARGGSGGR